MSKDGNQEDFKQVQSVLRQHASGRHPSDNLSLDHHEQEDGEQHHVEPPAPEQVSVGPKQLGGGWKAQRCVCLMFCFGLVVFSLVSFVEIDGPFLSLSWLIFVFLYIFSTLDIRKHGARF